MRLGGRCGKSKVEGPTKRGGWGNGVWDTTSGGQVGGSEAAGGGGGMGGGEAAVRKGVGGM